MELRKLIRCVPGIRVTVYFPPNLVVSYMSDCTVAKAGMLNQLLRFLEGYGVRDTS